MNNLPCVGIVILNFNGAQLTINCVDSVLKIDYPNFKIIVVDNASVDDSAVRLKAALTDRRVELLLNDKNEGYAGGNNRGIERALAEGAKYIFVLNNDTIADPGCLLPLVRFMEDDSRIAICGGRVFNVVSNGPPSGEIEREYSLFTASRAFFCDRLDLTAPREVDHVRGTAMLLRGEAIQKIGSFDPSFFLIWEDTDICYRARAAGYKVYLVPNPGVVHLVSQTLRKSKSTLLLYAIRNRAWFVHRHGKLRHWVVFNLYSFGYLYPRIFVGRLLRHEFKLLSPVLKGIWQGHYGRPRPLSDDAGMFSVRVFPTDTTTHH